MTKEMNNVSTANDEFAPTFVNTAPTTENTRLQALCADLGLLPTDVSFQLLPILKEAETLAQRVTEPTLIWLIELPIASIDDDFLTLWIQANAEYAGMEPSKFIASLICLEALSLL